LGRIDDQVKIRGYRVEPGEVAALLREHSEVKEAAVLVQKGFTGEKILVGYVVRKTGQEELKSSHLRSYLLERLPEYMVPATLVMLEHLPLLPNGKLDRKALPSADLAMETEKYVAPQNAVEEMLAGIWGRVLGVT